MHQANRHPVGDPVAQEHGRNIGNHHPERGAHDDRHKGLILGRQRHGGHLGLVTHLGQEEGDQGRAEDAEPGQLRLLFVELVGDEGPHRHADEREAEHPAQRSGGDQGGDPGAERAGKAMVGDGGKQDADDDGNGPAELGREDEGEQLGLVADFGEGDDARRDEKGFHYTHLAGISD